MSWADVRMFSAVGVVCAPLVLAACNSAPSPSANAAPATAAPESPSAGVVGAAIGRDLDAADREAAIAAQQEAVNSGSRKSWRGAHGAYGFIEPGPEGAAVSGCRDYNHKIFINGRAQQAKGQACKGPDGSWRVAS